MKRKVLVSHAWTQESIPHHDDFINQLKAKDCEVVHFPKQSSMTEDDLREWIPGCYAHICGGVAWTARAMEKADALKIIARIGVGFETVDIPAATARKIAVATTPGAGAETVSEFAFTLMTALSRRIMENDRVVRAGKWDTLTGHSIYRRTLGIVGFGLIGKQLARWVKSFGMKVVAYDPFEDKDYAAANGVTYLPLDELLKTADYVSLHLPLMDSTRKLIGKREFALMKPSAIFVNTARGGIVDEMALYEALKGRTLAGAALDVFEKEPVDMANPLLTLPNFIAAPHMAGSSFEGLDAIFGAAARNVLELIDGKPPHGIRNPEALG